MTEIQDLGLNWARRIAAAYIAWVESEQKSRTIEIKPYDPAPQISLAFYEAGEAELGILSK